MIPFYDLEKFPKAQKVASLFLCDLCVLPSCPLRLNSFANKWVTAKYAKGKIEVW